MSKDERDRRRLILAFLLFGLMLVAIILSNVISADHRKPGLVTWIYEIEVNGQTETLYKHTTDGSIPTIEGAIHIDGEGWLESIWGIPSKTFRIDRIGPFFQTANGIQSCRIMVSAR